MWFKTVCIAYVLEIFNFDVFLLESLKVMQNRTKFRASTPQTLDNLPADSHNELILILILVKLILISKQVPESLAARRARSPSAGRRPTDPTF